jgi:hypothetical protein
LGPFEKASKDKQEIPEKKVENETGKQPNTADINIENPDAN